MTTMPTDRNALNRALHRRMLHAKAQAQAGMISWEFATVTPEDLQPIPDYCGDMNAAIDALKALGLVPKIGWDRVMGADPEPWVAAIRVQDERTKVAYAVDTTPAALATALVQAVVQVLESDWTP
jgi:hypothetical protein